MSKKPCPADAVIAHRIRHARKLAGVSQEELGKTLGLSFQQIQKCENGINCVSVGRLVEIARALKVPVAPFFDGLESEQVEPSPSIGDDAMGIALAIDNLPLARRETVVAMIRAMLRVAAQEGEG